MKAIHKYVLPMLEESFVDMPSVNTIISAEMQEGFICVWAIVDTDSPIINKKFNLYKTGQEIKANVKVLKYIGIAKVNVGMELGMHVFEDTSYNYENDNK